MKGFHGLCPRCGKYRHMTKHHLFPRVFFGQKHNRAFLFLCWECHEELHHLLPEIKMPKEFYLVVTFKFIQNQQLLIKITDQNWREHEQKKEKEICHR